MMKWYISKKQELENAIPDIWLVSTRNKCILAVLLKAYDIYNIANVKK